MQFWKAGPEKDKAGELISTLIEESTSIESLRQAGYKIAEDMGQKDVMWVEAPLGSGRQTMEITEDCFLAIKA